VSRADLLEVFQHVASEVRSAVVGIEADALRVRTAQPGQYALDLVADEVALRILHAEGLAVVSEESGATGPDGAGVTVVLDPVDGSTNCARGISYWAISMCAVDEHGALAALVVNQATDTRYAAQRDRGATRNGVAIRASAVERVEDAVVALAGWPARRLAWKQFRALGCAALALCDLAAGGLDGYLDTGRWHAPWDYLGGMLICREAGAVVSDRLGEELVVVDLAARRQLVGAATPALHDALRTAIEVDA
jgi:myo-inositol-1(or 4)-monophosphatase